MRRNFRGLIPDKEEEFINERIKKAKEQLIKDNFRINFCGNFAYDLWYDYRPQLEYGFFTVTANLGLIIKDIYALEKILKWHPLVLEHIKDLHKAVKDVEARWDYENGGLIKKEE